MPETPEIYQMRVNINQYITADLVVEAFNKPERVFPKRKLATHKVEEKRPSLPALAGATLLFCSSRNSEIALIFNKKTTMAVKISCALGAVLFWATKGDLKKLPLDLNFLPKTRTNFYITFINSDQILVMLDTSQNMNMAIWKLIYNFDLKKITFWNHKTPDAYDNPEKLLNFIIIQYQTKFMKYNPLYLFEFLEKEQVFGGLFGQYTKSEVIARLHKAFGVSYFITVSEFEKKYGFKLLIQTLSAFLVGNRKYAQFYDPLTHNLPAIKHFIMDFLTAYRKPYCIMVGKKNKKVYVPSTERNNLPNDIKVMGKKQNKISKNDLGVGMLCWHSVSNWQQPGFNVIYSEIPKPPPLPPKQPISTTTKSKKRNRKRNRPGVSQRLRKKINTGFS
jgi:hypothetical protein